MQSHDPIKQSSDNNNQSDPSKTQNENENMSNTIHVSNSEENEGIQESHTSSVSDSKTNDEFTIFNDDAIESSANNWRVIQDTSNTRYLNCQRHRHHEFHQNYKLSFSRCKLHEIRLLKNLRFVKSSRTSTNMVILCSQYMEF